MSENTTNNKIVRDDEIDLLDLFRRMGRTLTKWLNALGRAFLISAVFILRRWLPLGLSIVLGVGASFLLKFTSDSSYTSDLVLRANAVDPTDLISYINRLHTYCLEKNKIALTEAIYISQNQADNIEDINAYWVIDNGNDDVPDFIDYSGRHNVYDTVNIRMQDRLNIWVKIKDAQELVTIRDGLIKYINSDPLFQQKNIVRLRQNNELLKRFDYDILQLDSLQKVKYFEETRNMQPKTGGQMIFLQEQKTQLVYTDIYDLYEKKQKLELEMDLYQDIVTVLSDFSIPAKRMNGGLYYAKIYVPLFFLLTLLILIILANRRKLTEIYNKY